METVAWIWVLQKVKIKVQDSIAHHENLGDMMIASVKTMGAVTKVMVPMAAVAAEILDKSKAEFVMEEVYISACHHTDPKTTIKRNALSMVRDLLAVSNKLRLKQLPVIKVMRSN